MASIGDMAKGYESPQTKNITELAEVNVNMECEERTFQNKEGKDFTVNITKINGEEYRVPNSVLKQLREHIQEKPDLQTFKVKSSGTGMNTTYTVITLE